MIWTLENLIKSASSTQTEKDGKWVPSRPINWKYRTLPEKIKEAYAVFTGKAEAFTWPDQN